MTAFEQLRAKLLLAPVQGVCLTDEDRSCMDQEIDEILERISRMSSIDSADRMLQELGLIQENLATICFKYQVLLSDKQRKLVRKYDRWDDLGCRMDSFQAIKNGCFP